MRTVRTLWIVLSVGPVLLVSGCGEVVPTESETATSSTTQPSAHQQPTTFHTHCDQNITAGSNTSCGLADAVFKVYAKELANGGAEDFNAVSPVTGKTYAMACSVHNGVTCTGGHNIQVAFPLWAARAYEQPPEPSESTAPYEPPPEEEAEEETEPEASEGGFCSTHECIPNYPNGRGYPVECSDGEWSKSGGIQGACSGHGGER